MPRWLTTLSARSALYNATTMAPALCLARPNQPLVSRLWHGLGTAWQ